MTPAEAKQITAFLKRHSGNREKFGPQCRCKRRLGEMTDRAMAAVLLEETGLSPSRPWLAKTCDEIGVERRKRSGPIPMPASEKREKNSTRWRNWIANFKKTDPQGYEQWVEDRRKKRQKVAA